MPLTVAEFQEILFASDDLDELVTALFTGGDDVPWAFVEDAGLYDQFRHHVAAGLHVAPNDIYIVGSGQTGFAMSPDAFPRAFHEFSDIDVAIVAPDLFDRAWLSIVRWGHPRRHRLPAPEWKWLRARQEEVFWGWISPHALKFQGLQFPGDLATVRDFRASWFSLFRGLGNQFPGTTVAGRDVSGRLYRSFDHLVRYQSESLRRLRYRLATGQIGDP